MRKIHKMLNVKGFALVQALFFMMFIMAVISITMMMSVQRSTTASGERMATDAYPVVNALLTYAIANSQSSTSGTEYFTNNPISKDYCQKQLVADGFIQKNSNDTQCDNSDWSSNLTITIT